MEADGKILLQRIKREEGKEAHTPTEEEYEQFSPPDHFARLTAFRIFISLVTAGRPPARYEDKTSDGMLTLDQIVAALERSQATSEKT